MLTHARRLLALRAELARRRLDGFIVPIADEHMSEYVGAHAQRLAWLTGFTGSAATAVALPASATIFVDGRYTLQVRQEVDERHWSFQSLPQTNFAEWLCKSVPEGAQIGYDPWLHPKGWVAATRTALDECGGRLVPVPTNPVDAVWLDRPALSAGKAIVYPTEIAGESSVQKRQQIATWLRERKADAVVLAALDSIAWTLNIRGQDADYTPVVAAYVLLNADATADLFIALEKLTDAVIEHLGGAVRLHPREVFLTHLSTLAGRRIVADPERTAAAILEAIEAAGAKVVEAPDPAALPKATKNAVEIAGHKAAQLRDAAAIARFLHWMSTAAPAGAVTEYSAAARLRQFREATGGLRDLAFETISSFGPNSAFIHYRVSEGTNRTIVPDGLYLVDSGGQYFDGTTDVTRTIAIGTPTAEMRDRFTRVLKGHIAVARAVFPAGTNGGQLDTLARQHLWAAGLDYAHGTGHGVGSYLCVHEGPQRIGRVGDCSAPLLPGMILSNEPGYYKAGHYGIRIENLLLVVEREAGVAESGMLGFETLTFAPIDRALIDLAMLTTEECAWLDAYHAAVARIVAPQLEGSAKAWLAEATRPVS